MQRTQRVTMGLVGVLVAHLLLVPVAEAQVLAEAYFCQDGLYVQPVLPPSLESTMYKHDNTACNQPLPYPFLVQPLPPPRRSAEDTGGVTPPLEPVQ